MNEAAPTPRRRRIWMAGIAIGAAAVLSLFFVFDPTQNSFFPRCWLHESTGLHCPGCGGQRALHALIHGDIMRAFGHNFLVMSALPLVAWHYGRKLWWQIKKLPPRLSQSPNPVLVWTIVMGSIAFGVLRNLPMEPFVRLAP